MDMEKAKRKWMRKFARSQGYLLRDLSKEGLKRLEEAAKKYKKKYREAMEPSQP